MCTFKPGPHELVDAAAAVERINISSLGTGDQVERALVRVRDGVGAADWVVVSRTDSMAADTSPINTVFTSSTAFHLFTRVCSSTVYHRYTRWPKTEITFWLFTCLKYLNQFACSLLTNKYSSAVAERPHDASCLSVVSFNSIIPRAQYSITGYFSFKFTAAYS